MIGDVTLKLVDKGEGANIQNEIGEGGEAREFDVECALERQGGNSDAGASERDDSEAITMIDKTLSDTQCSYDLVADLYVERIYGELDHKPIDCQLLDRFVERANVIGPACDMGCGPGHVARYIHDRGGHVIGIDLSPAMIEHARKLNPGIEFSQGDMRSLEIEDETFGGIVAFYSIIHIPRAQVVPALVELKRILRPGVCCFWPFTSAITFCTWTNGGAGKSRSTLSFSVPTR